MASMRHNKRQCKTVAKKGRRRHLVKRAVAYGRQFNRSLHIRHSTHSTHRRKRFSFWNKWFSPRPNGRRRSWTWDRPDA